MWWWGGRRVKRPVGPLLARAVVRMRLLVLACAMTMSEPILLMDMPSLRLSTTVSSPCVGRSISSSSLASSCSSARFDMDATTAMPLVYRSSLFNILYHSAACRARGRERVSG